MNIFDFIDYLEQTGFKGGTANENRYFLFTTVEKALEATDNASDVISAYESIGVTFPERAFNRIFDAYLNSTGPAYIIQYLAPNSLIPDEAIPLSDYPGESNYIAESDIAIFDEETQTTRIQHWRHYFDELGTPRELKNDISDSVARHYKWSVLEINITRMYKSS